MNPKTAENLVNELSPSQVAALIQAVLDARGGGIDSAAPNGSLRPGIAQRPLGVRGEQSTPTGNQGLPPAPSLDPVTKFMNRQMLQSLQQGTGLMNRIGGFR